MFSLMPVPPPPPPPPPITSPPPVKNYGNSFFSRLFFAEEICALPLDAEDTNLLLMALKSG